MVVIYSVQEFCEGQLRTCSDNYSSDKIFLINKYYKIFYFFLISGPRHGKTCPLAYTDREGPDQPAHPRRLI